MPCSRTPALHAIDDVVAAAVLDDDRVDAVQMQQMAEQQPGRTCADDSDLRPDAVTRSPQNPVLHAKLAASSVLPLPLYFATSG